MDGPTPLNVILRKRVLGLQNVFYLELLGLDEGFATNLGIAKYVSQRFLSVVSGTSRIYDELCRRFLNFIATCHSSDSELIHSVIMHAILCVQVQWPVGRNYMLWYERYSFKVEDELRLVSNLRAAVVRSQCTVIDRCHITLALELIKLRAGILYTPECEWS